MSYTIHQGDELQLIPTEPRDRDSWLTPRWILQQLGRFDMDPCACAESPEWVCHVYRTKEHDGLSVQWAGRVFLNPPFSDLRPWLERMAQHGNGIALLPAGHETDAWLKYVWASADAVLLLAGRTRFVLPNQLASGGRPRVPIALVAWGLDNVEALDRFQCKGVILRQWEVKGA